MGCGRWGQEYYPTLVGKLCRSCARDAGDLRSVKDIEADRLMRSYPAGAYCKLDTSGYVKPTRTAFVPGRGRVEFEVVWNGT